VPNPNPTTSTPLTLRPDQTSSAANYNKWAKEKGHIREDATAGASCSSTIAVTPQTLGEKGEFSKKEVNKKLGGYTNQLSRGGPVKIGKAK
jgi:hypothetical protein